MTFQGAKINRARGRRGIAIVKTDALTDSVKADGLITALEKQVFRNTPVVLMAQDPQFGPVYYGRADLVRFLEELDVSQIPWVEYTVTSSAPHDGLAKERAAFHVAAHEK